MNWRLLTIRRLRQSRIELTIDDRQCLNSRPFAQSPVLHCEWRASGDGGRADAEQGHTLSYTYDSSFRLVGVTDALGQVSTFAYEHSDPNLLTKVTDPFGRFATLGYDAEGRLNSITDAAGMTSTFTYGNNDFIVAMTTPYGTTTFRHEPSSSTTGTFRAIEATDPVGGRERLEFHLETTEVDETAPSGEVPSGFSGANNNLHLYNSFYWDKLAMAEHPGDYASFGGEPPPLGGCMSDDTRPTAAERDSAEPPPRSVTPQDRLLFVAKVP